MIASITGDQDKGIRIQNKASYLGPHVKDLGNKIDGMQNGMELALDLDALGALWGKTGFLAPCFKSEANRRSK